MDLILLAALVTAVVVTVRLLYPHRIEWPD
jgi:hypothetical protein